MSEREAVTATAERTRFFTNDQWVEARRRNRCLHVLGIDESIMVADGR